MRSLRLLMCLLAGMLVLVVSGCAAKRIERDYSAYVWPPPPDRPRIELVDILYGRADVEAGSNLQKTLLGTTPGPYDHLRKPSDVAFDREGRLLVTDIGRGAIFRFDRNKRVLDILGRGGRVQLKVPVGISVAPDGTIYVADVGLKRVVAMNGEGDVLKVYGDDDTLVNPTDAVVSPDGKRLLVADSKAHRIIVFDVATTDMLRTFGERGEGEGQFAWPTSLAFGPDGDLFVVDQINSRIQILTEDGRFLDEFGSLGAGFANFVRPKDVVVDHEGLIYVTDAAFNNVQLFDSDLQLLTFIGEGGKGPGRFHHAAGIDIQGDRFAVVDQNHRRVQVFRYIAGRQ